MPVSGGTTLKLSNAFCPQRRNAYRSWLRSYSIFEFEANASSEPKWSTCTEWSMTRSTGWSGLMRFGSPPNRRMPSRMAAKSITAGTPVRSCSRMRAGMNAISFSGFAAGSHPASARMSSADTCRSSSHRSRFSNRIFKENGSRSTGREVSFAKASSRKIR